jgi:hypothetical protein
VIVRESNITVRAFEAALLRAGVAVGLIVLAAGCQRQYWYQEGRTFAECRTDYEDCHAELHKRTDRRYASSYKHRFLENCMQQRGYRLVAEKDLPLDIKREDPDVPSEVPWVHAYGVAGALNAGSLSLPPDGAPAKSAALAHR